MLTQAAEGLAIAPNAIVERTRISPLLEALSTIFTFMT